MHGDASRVPTAVAPERMNLRASDKSRGPARDRARHLAGSLTDREAQVLACLGEGLSNAQIAAHGRPGIVSP
jgi:DNA-binding NarL/FixJ family response regulator